ncbi:MAG: apolipoprotein N-acyltransferase [Syntrophaceae bacterium]|nr:apolipoprotein N-acyltransferase [Syntrophaceae bacterium]
MIKSVLAAAISGACLAVAFPPFQYDLLVWTALVPLLWSIHNSQNPSQAAFYGWVSGLVFFLIDVRWIYETLTVHGHLSVHISILILVTLVIVLAGYFGLFAFFARFIQRSSGQYWLIFPICWVGVEYMRTYFWSGFPWDLVGYSLSQRGNLIQVVDITGVYGLSFLIVFVNSVILETVLNRRTSLGKVLVLLTSGLLLVSGCYIYAQEKFRHHGEQTNSKPFFTVGILQGAIPQGVKWSESYRSFTFKKYEDLAEQSVTAGADLLIWPETSVPVVIGGEDLAWMEAVQISQKLNKPMLIGAPSQTNSAGEINYFNSAFLIDGSEILADYDKIHLVPFGEYMPLAWLLPLGPGMAAREADFTPGVSMKVLKPPNTPPFSVLICYEAIFPDLSRMAVNNGATFLVNITNDGWFDTSSAPYQHLAMAKFRSIENRKWLVRSANTGISAAFNPLGELVDSIPLGESGWINVRLTDSTNHVITFYTKYGDVFAWICIIILILEILFTLLRKEKYTGVRNDTFCH